MMRLLISLSVFLLFPLGVFASDAPRVVVSIKPIHSLASHVMAGVASPELLLNGSQSPHNFALRPSDVRKIARADLIVWVGAGLEMPLAKTLKTAKSTTGIVELLKDPKIDLLETREEAHWDEQSHGDHRHHSHTLDPHIWLSPLNAERVVQLLVSELSRVDPVNREKYYANGVKTVLKLKQLDRDIKRQIQGVRHVPYLVFHDAYQHFERRYGLNAVGSVTVSPDRSPGARHVMALRNKIKGQTVRCIFSEPQFKPKLVQMLIKDSKVKSGVLDPLGVDLPAGKDNYFKLMRNLAASLNQCLSN